MSLLVKSPNQILEDIIRVYKAGLIGIGVSSPQVGPGSDIYILATAIANEIAVAEQNIVVSADAQMPDTAVGSDLDRILAIYGLSRKPATTASGYIKLVSSQSVLIASGTELVSATGLIYKVSIGGTYADQALIKIESVDTGSGVNLPVNSVLTWQSAPTYAQSTTAVYSEIIGGAEAEDDESARQRLLNIFQNPPQYGNWQDVANLSESFDPAVQKSFIFSCANGPGTQHIALIGAPNYSKNLVTRDVPLVNVANVTSSIIGNLPAYTETVVTTVQNAYMDVSFKLTLPYPVGAPNLGTGGGWLDFSPFPIPNDIGANHDGINSFAFCFVSTVTNSTSFIISSPKTIPPIAGVTRISWIDKANGWIVRTAIIQTTSGTGPYTVTIDQPFTGIAVNDYIFPSSTNAQNYVNAILNKFALIGPGEKISSASTLFSRAARKPRPTLSFSNQIDNTMTKAIINAGSEVYDCDFYARYANISQTSGTAQQSLLSPNVEVGSLAPPLPSSITYNPIVYIPNNIGLYPNSNQ